MNNPLRLEFDELMAMKMPEVREYAAQHGYGVGFGEKKNDAINRIVELQNMMQPKPKEEPETKTEVDDILLRTTPPAKNVTQKEIEEACQPFIDRGLHLTFPCKETFNMKYKKKEDSGNIRTSLRVIISRANIICR